MRTMKIMFVVLLASIFVGGISYVTGISHLTYTFMKGSRFVLYLFIFYSILSLMIGLNFNYFLSNNKMAFKILRSGLLGYLSSIFGIYITEIVWGGGIVSIIAPFTSLEVERIFFQFTFPLVLLGWLYGIFVFLCIYYFCKKTQLGNKVDFRKK